MFPQLQLAQSHNMDIHGTANAQQHRSRLAMQRSAAHTTTSRLEIESKDTDRLTDNAL